MMCILQKLDIDSQINVRVQDLNLTRHHIYLVDSNFSVEKLQKIIENM